MRAGRSRSTTTRAGCFPPTVRGGSGTRVEDIDGQSYCGRDRGIVRGTLTSRGRCGERLPPGCVRRCASMSMVLVLLALPGRNCNVSGRLFTSESVTEGHPDKICDAISDSVLDALLAGDPKSRVAVETAVTTGQVHVIGEVTTNARRRSPTSPLIVRKRIKEIGTTRRRRVSTTRPAGQHRHRRAVTRHRRRRGHRLRSPRRG